MPIKPKTNQPETLNKVQGRDLFQTPNYAIDLLIPFIPKNIVEIWECAAGELKISNRLKNKGYRVLSTDIRGLELEGVVPENFLTDIKRTDIYRNPTAIITNPPFSLKYKFINRAIEYNVPFAFLIPFDMCQKMIKLFIEHNLQMIVPSRRIDYIPPSGKGSGSQFHSAWIVNKFFLPKQLIFVELSLDQKRNNI